MNYEYRFSSKQCSRRYHLLCAYAASDEELQIATPAVIIEAFEKQFMVELRWDPFARRNVKVERRLLGFRGSRAWSNATLLFSVRSPEIPFFGVEASRLCPSVPIMYWSFAPEAATPRRFFLSGQEFCKSELPAAYREKFAKLEELKSGYIPGRLTIDSFLSHEGGAAAL